MSRREFFVACLCADWCSTCRDYRGGFHALERRYPQAEFRWVDIEDEASRIGELEVENFPTLLVQRGAQVLFFGVMPPVHEHLRRLLDKLLAQSPEESRRYALGTPERRTWQAHAGLRGALESG